MKMKTDNGRQTRAFTLVELLMVISIIGIIASLTVVGIASARFAGLAPLARHRLVYDAVADLMGTEVHALSIDARLPA